MEDREGWSFNVALIHDLTLSLVLSKWSNFIRKFNKVNDLVALNYVPLVYDRV